MPIPNAPGPCWTLARERICWLGMASCRSTSQHRNWDPIIPSSGNCASAQEKDMRRTLSFTYYTGIIQPVFHNPMLVGSWDATGRYSARWSEKHMDTITGPDGCPSFHATQEFESD